MSTPQASILHEGELEAQRRFGAAGFWSEHMLNSMIREQLTPSWAAYLESLPFFFIATANREGACDCSFRGREFNASGRPYPLLKVLDAHTLVFPDFAGNKLYNSLGNILSNPHIGMLFMDFEQRSRARVNGRAEIIEQEPAFATVWPTAQRFIKVSVQQAYPNCRARIPRMQLVPPGDAWFDE